VTLESTSARIGLGRIACTLPVTDVGRSVAFYERFLGLSVAFTNGEPTGFVILGEGEAELHLTRVAHRTPSSHNAAHVLVGDANALYEILEQAGVRIVKGLRDADHGLRGFVFCDPDGNRIDVGQPLKP
jgi:catechol 2,3-dioxygenase-like lactoylglutathione lyase family enzyme